MSTALTRHGFAQLDQKLRREAKEDFFFFNFHNTADERCDFRIFRISKEIQDLIMGGFFDFKYPFYRFLLSSLRAAMYERRLAREEFYMWSERGESYWREIF